MMKCALCKIRSFRQYKVVHGVEIVACRNCGLLISKRDNVLSKASLYTSNSIYSEQEYLQLLHKHVKKVRYILSFLKKEGNSYESVLDLGGGYGLLADQFARNGVSVTLVEPHLKPFLLKKQQKVRVVKKSIEYFLSTSRKKYDLITLIDVIEHFDDPTKILKSLKRHLTKEGRICIVAPNYHSIMQYVSFDWAWWMVEDHRVHLSPQLLTRLADAAGYGLEKQETFEMLEDFIKNTEGAYQRVTIPILRRLFKLFFFYPFIVIYFLLRPLVWKMRWGGLHLALLKIK